MQSEILQAWRRASERLDQAKEFVNETRQIEQAAREQVYASRVLMLYASAQFGVQELGAACVRRLNADRRTPARLPARVQQHHLTRSMNKVLKEASAADWAWTSAQKDLIGMAGPDWAEHSSLHEMDGNAWPDRIKEYCKRFSATEPDFNWTKTLVNSSGERLEGQFALLVQERNPLAHGYLDPNVKSADIMLDWAEEARTFLQYVYMTVARAVFNDLPSRTQRLGTRDRSIELGPNTVAIAHLDQSVRVGDFVVLRARGSDQVRSATIVSMMHHGAQLTEATAGATEVALQLSSRPARCELYSPP